MEFFFFSRRLLYPLLQRDVIGRGNDAGTPASVLGRFYGQRPFLPSGLSAMPPFLFSLGRRRSSFFVGERPFHRLVFFPQNAGNHPFFPPFLNLPFFLLSLRPCYVFGNGVFSTRPYSAKGTLKVRTFFLPPTVTSLPLQSRTRCALSRRGHLSPREGHRPGLPHGGPSPVPSLFADLDKLLLLVGKIKLRFVSESWKFLFLVQSCATPSLSPSPPALCGEPFPGYEAKPFSRDFLFFQARYRLPFFSLNPFPPFPTRSRRESPFFRERLASWASTIFFLPRERSRPPLSLSARILWQRN